MRTTSATGYVLAMLMPATTYTHEHAWRRRNETADECRGCAETRERVAECAYCQDSGEGVALHVSDVDGRLYCESCVDPSAADEWCERCEDRPAMTAQSDRWEARFCWECREALRDEDDHRKPRPAGWRPYRAASRADL